MRIRTVFLSAVTLVLTGCQFTPTSQPVELYLNEHTLQELCDYPRQFFANRYHVSDLTAKPAQSKSMNSQIDAFAGCFYEKSATEGGKQLGHVLLHQENNETKSIPDNSRVQRLTVDGVTVIEIVEPLGDLQDPNTARPAYTLQASIDGWRGELRFTAGDEQGAQAGAPILVGMIRTLKGPRIPSAS
ncbi:hypothetical protein [Nocardia amikacinitolerans]|uniref:hypothetical protein n=1 Tax=Nocardia amikacinitolerans TaxID=756689 RepID=UPI0012EED431|nr:hypothetical protein [Nocardia amikacinitolerans]